MQLELIKPAKALNKAYLKEKVSRDDIERFKTGLMKMMGRINEAESEENGKNIISDFLKETWYGGHYEMNTKDKKDLVIHTGKSSKDKVGVIVETKKPKSPEMITGQKPNAKALQELILYYLRERIDENNTDIRHLIISDIYQWYIIDEIWFEKGVYRNSNLKKNYENWKLSGKDTKFFYESIAKPFIDEWNEVIPVAHFDLRDFEKYVTNTSKADDVKLISLYKILSPVHLLKQAFANDSNSLDTRFYTELLHIIGLEEIKEGSKKLIKRKTKPDEASLLENTIIKLEDKDVLRNIRNLSSFGSTREEQLFTIALELCITWINRILFIKLLEAQLVAFHKGDKEYLFLNSRVIHDFDELSNLFFQVLAEKPAERRPHIQSKFSRVPYLNSSLFERTELERQTISISELDNRLSLPLFLSTVLKDDKGKKRSGELSALSYLFEFLDAYDFTSEGEEEIQEENKNLINASVLGLIFEKINGYKDGSFFTPGFITMYMCRETIRRAVLQKFREVKNWECESLTDLYNKIDDKKEANSIINSIRICDPAVGSGHFLVSALNEMLAIKSELKILQDADGRTLRDYTVEVVNDELIVTDDDNRLFEYKPNNKESQRVQETLFHEKETIIENCLFGVDINPNSVKICRLRLWIELLKNAYYTKESDYKELETLPNIDINIKCGNSLISRFALDADIKTTLKRSKWTITSYRLAVQTYRNARSKDEKRAMEELIESIKKDFRSYISPNDPKYKKLSKLRGEMLSLSQTKELFEEGNKNNKETKNKLEKLAGDINKLEQEIEEIKNNKIYENAFEWRFEFPEVLNDEGDYVGFDVVIGNPPYVSLSKFKSFTDYFSNGNFITYTNSGDLYCLFYELGAKVLKNFGFLAFITSNSWLRSKYGEILKKYFIDYIKPLVLINIEDIQVFTEATVESNIIILQKGNQFSSFSALNLSRGYKFQNSLSEYFNRKYVKIDFNNGSDWFSGDEIVGKLKFKIESGSKKLGEFSIKINFGIKTGYNEAFLIDKEKQIELIGKDKKNQLTIKPILRGRDIKKYSFQFEDIYLINTHNGIKGKNFPRINAQIDFPTIYEHLSTFLPKVEMRYDQGDHWSNLRNCAYLEEFDKPKIIWGEISDKPKFAYDESGYFAEATTFLMTGEKLKFLLGILNSKLSEWYFKLIGTTTGMGTNRWKKYKIEQLPIKLPSIQQERDIEDLVDQILEKKKNQVGFDTSELENKIDDLIFELYGLSEDEIHLIENS